MNRITKIISQGQEEFDKNIFRWVDLENGDPRYIDSNQVKSFLKSQQIALLEAVKESLPREVLAELEHNQWILWSKNIAETENITPERLERWKILWRPYSELTEAEKDQDREWADKVILIMQSSLEEAIKEVKNI